MWGARYNIMREIVAPAGSIQLLTITHWDFSHIYKCIISCSRETPLIIRTFPMHVWFYDVTSCHDTSQRFICSLHIRAHKEFAANQMDNFFFVSSMKRNWRAIKKMDFEYVIFFERRKFTALLTAMGVDFFSFVDNFQCFRRF